MGHKITLKETNPIKLILKCNLIRCISKTSKLYKRETLINASLLNMSVQNFNENKGRLSCKISSFMSIIVPKLLSRHAFQRNKKK